VPKGFILPEEEQKTLKETGGYSGPQLFDRSGSYTARSKDDLTRKLRRLLDRLIRVGRRRGSLVKQKTLKETGGYSGPQLFDRSVALVARYRALLDQGPKALRHGVGSTVGSVADDDAVDAGVPDSLADAGDPNRRPNPVPKGFILPEEEQKTLKETGGYSGPQLLQR
jgi:dihydroorotate dehydrogenase